MNCFRKNLTQQINESLANRMFGKKTNHFLIYLRGVPSINSTGVGKTSVGMEIAKMFDPKFGIEKMAFTNEGLIDVMKKLGKVTQTGEEIPQVFMRDETPATLKRRADIEFQIVSETLRDSRISLIVIKPVGEPMDLAHYVLEPFLMAEDMSLVRCAVYNPGLNKYRGYYDVHIHVDSDLWKKYMIQKKQFQQDVIDRKVGVFDVNKYLKDFFEEHNSADVIKYNQKGVGRLDTVRTRRFLNTMFPNLTHEERQFIMDALVEDLQIRGEIK